MFFGLSQFAKKSELGIEVPRLHAFLKLVERHAFFDFGHVFILRDPLVRQVLRRFGPLYNNIRLCVAAVGRPQGALALLGLLAKRFPWLSRLNFRLFRAQAVFYGHDRS